MQKLKLVALLILCSSLIWGQDILVKEYSVLTLPLKAANSIFGDGYSHISPNKDSNPAGSLSETGYTFTYSQSGIFTEDASVGVNNKPVFFGAELLYADSSERYSISYTSLKYESISYRMSQPWHSSFAYAYDVERSEYLITFSYGRKLFPFLSLGINVEAFERKSNLLNEEANLYDTRIFSSPAFIIDLGLEYEKTDILFSDNLTVGVTLNNFGTEYREIEHMVNYPWSSYRAFDNYNGFLAKIPRFAGIQFCYSIYSFINRGNGASLSVIGAYKNLLNYGKRKAAIYGGTMTTQFYTIRDESSERDYWSSGINFSSGQFYFGLGGVRLPYTSDLAKKKDWSLRGGAGGKLNLLRKLCGLPVDILFNFTAIRRSNRKYLPAFDIGLNGSW